MHVHARCLHCVCCRCPSPAISSTSFAASAAEAAFAIPDPRPALAKDTGINVSKYVQDNYTPYGGDSSFLAGPSERTKALWAVLEKMCCEELTKGISGVDPHVPSTITAFGPGYINKEKEVIVGLQTDEPLKRAIKPLGGINMVKAALHVSGRLDCRGTGVRVCGCGALHCKECKQAAQSTGSMFLYGAACSMAYVSYGAACSMAYIS